MSSPASTRRDSAAVAAIRDSSRRIVRELGFLRPTLAETPLPASAVHALVEIGARGATTAAELGDVLILDKSTISRMLRKLVEAGEIAERPSEQDGRAKALSLTPRGRRTLAAIDAVAETRVAAALDHLGIEDRAAVVGGLAAYAAALAKGRRGEASRGAPVRIESGYRPGLLGHCTEMHARYYAEIVGFGGFFEARVASGLAEFAGRLDRPMNRIFAALDGETAVGTVAIDGEDLGEGIAHLRWFIVGQGWQGQGIGRRLLAEAVAFSDRSNFAEIRLWTFRGLDAARRLYETFGFELEAEWEGDQWGSPVTEQRFLRRRGAAAVS